MKIVIIGSVIFSKNLIDDILKNKFEIKGIIGKKNNKFNSDYFDIVKYFKEKGINCTYSKDINNKRTYNWIKKINPDLIICLGWSRLLNKKILSLPNIGAIGYHPADIPSNKGRHPIIWSLALGLKKAASTFFLMNESIGPPIFPEIQLAVTLPQLLLIFIKATPKTKNIKSTTKKESIY